MNERVRPCPYCDGTGMLRRARAETTAEIVALRKAGTSVRDLARRYGVTRQAIYDRLKRAERAR